MAALTIQAPGTRFLRYSRSLQTAALALMLANAYGVSTTNAVCSQPPPSLPPALKCAGLEDDNKCKIKNCADNAGALKKCEKLCKKKKLKTKCQKTCCDLSP